MARGIYQSDRTSAPSSVGAEIAKRKEHDARGTHRWHESEVDGVPERQCMVKACGAFEIWSEREGRWV